MSAVRRVSLAVVVVAAAFALIAPMTPRAEAHERRTVAANYTFVVGFIGEPVFLEEPNGIDLRVTNAQTNEPVEGLEKTVKAEITAGGQSKTVDLRARFGQRGAYTADVIPTRGGSWVFRFFGDINGAAINERFESGPGRFNEPQSRTEIQFPVTVPSNAELSQQIQRGAQPAESAATSGGSTEDVQRALDRADSARTTALTFGIIGTVVGLLGLALAAYALATRRAGTRAGGQPEPV